MQTVYRALVPENTQDQLGADKGMLEEGNAGLEMFQFRNIFFRVSDSNHPQGDVANVGARHP
ncbi:hypothetical protein BDV06DRAFT_194882 [Aspergillus oleicola]